MIIFTGVAGSGKSVQGRMLADERGYPWLSTGEFLRMIVAGEPRKRMLEGKLLHDDEIIAIIERVFNLISFQEEFVLDGFPRTMKQADWLIDFAQNHGADVSLVIHMVADQATVRERLLARGRPDDHAEAIDERFEEYEQSIKPILDLLKQRGIRVVDIEANRSIAEIHQEIVAVVTEHTKED